MPLFDGISRKQLQQLAMDTLTQAATLASDRVYEPRDWPTDPSMFPILLISAPRDKKIGMYPGQATFTTTISLVVVGRVVGATAEDANAQVDELSEQIEDALLTNPAFIGVIQQFVTIETQTVVDAQSRDHIGEIGMTFELEIFQSYGPVGVPLIDVRGTITNNGTASVIFDQPLPT
jgi:hypothetical protein